MDFFICGISSHLNYLLTNQVRPVENKSLS
jgi:hypothetical protein